MPWRYTVRIGWIALAVAAVVLLATACSSDESAEDPAQVIVDSDGAFDDIKAITYHGLKVEHADDGWLAEVIVDI